MDKNNRFVRQEGEFCMIGDTLVSCVTRSSRITIPDGITCIWSAAFKKCRHLQEIIIPVSVTNVAADAFSKCRRLKVLRYLGTREQQQKIWRGQFRLASFFEPQWICEGERIDNHGNN